MGTGGDLGALQPPLPMWQWRGALQEPTSSHQGCCPHEQGPGEHGGQEGRGQGHQGRKERERLCRHEGDTLTVTHSTPFVPGPLQTVPLTPKLPPYWVFSPMSQTRLSPGHQPEEDRAETWMQSYVAWPHGLFQHDMLWQGLGRSTRRPGGSDGHRGLLDPSLS